MNRWLALGLGGALGALIGAAWVVAFTGSYNVFCRSDHGEDVLVCVREWQSLIGGLTALAASAVGILVLLQQIRLQREQFHQQMLIASAEQRARAAQAARSLAEKIRRLVRNSSDDVLLAGDIWLLKDDPDFLTLKYFLDQRLLRETQQLMVEALKAHTNFLAARSAHLAHRGVDAVVELDELSFKLTGGWRPPEA